MKNYITEDTIIIIPGYNMRFLRQQIDALCNLYQVIEKSDSDGHLGYVILRKWIVDSVCWIKDV